ncbi:deoxynucleoside kinase [Nitrosomonas eutropha]|uniref:Deoxyadenosine/deoxycytidine kinase n=2 Tax=Nitrosomonas eutropha TaxID=916 RepID=A0ABX5M6P8_9PROT|nr:deoxynucleoside kinase [Nitrosomonas eutropha]ABI60511.1 deoxynucleoside kinase [Nitrosomonas eutropha C91]PXV79370.1 deoxyadenosine/deoxycytidine kinase [Nitrosomonas eutropha]SCX23125.1 Deoxyadenosine/deoxycytidine kinase [Nitrosomonas eutropha]SEJ11380.1 Deoxyadenosine/deoxycytidine kinase [Nitrosomonas eutropha]
MNLERCRYIVVEGPVGAGKTSLARNMATRLNCSLMLEQPEANPFLEKFYEDTPRYALSTQLFFLLQRRHQLQLMRQENGFSQSVVSDFLFEKGQLFAAVALSEPEHGLYRQICEQMPLDAPAPDLVIYLQVSPEVLIKRIRQRGNTLEQNISEDYLRRLAERYMQFFHEYDRAPVMIVNSEHIDLANSIADFDLLLTRIDQMRSAREYFNVGAS